MNLLILRHIFVIHLRIATCTQKYTKNKLIAFNISSIWLNGFWFGNFRTWMKKVNVNKKSIYLCLSGINEHVFNCMNSINIWVDSKKKFATFPKSLYINSTFLSAVCLISCDLIGFENLCAQQDVITNNLFESSKYENWRRYIWMNELWVHSMKMSQRWIIVCSSSLWAMENP